MMNTILKWPCDRQAICPRAYPTSRPLVAGIDSSPPATLIMISRREWMNGINILKCSGGCGSSKLAVCTKNLCFYFFKGWWEYPGHETDGKWSRLRFCSVYDMLDQMVKKPKNQSVTFTGGGECFLKELYLGRNATDILNTFNSIWFLNWHWYGREGMQLSLSLSFRVKPCDLLATFHSSFLYSSDHWNEKYLLK